MLYSGGSCYQMVHFVWIIERVMWCIYFIYIFNLKYICENICKKKTPFTYLVNFQEYDFYFQDRWRWGRTLLEKGLNRDSSFEVDRYIQVGIATCLHWPVYSVRKITKVKSSWNAIMCKEYICKWSHKLYYIFKLFIIF